MKEQTLQRGTPHKVLASDFVVSLVIVGREPDCAESRESFKDSSVSR